MEIRMQLCREKKSSTVVNVKNDRHAQGCINKYFAKLLPFEFRKFNAVCFEDVMIRGEVREVVPRVVGIRIA